MTTAIIGTGGLGSAIARQLSAGGESLRLSSADTESAQTLARAIGPPASVAVDNHDASRGADAVVLALRFSVLESVIDEISDSLADRFVVVPSNPVSLDSQGKLMRLVPEGQSSGEVVAGVVAGGDGPGHGVWNHVGQSPRVVQQADTGAGGSFLSDRR